jgi:ketosteroid isomerase-like protein
MFYACSSGGNPNEGKYADAIKAIDSSWDLYEMTEDENGHTNFKIEVSDVVKFDKAKKTIEAFQKIDPKLSGMVEWYNSDVGMTLRKMEILPAT